MATRRPLRILAVGDIMFGDSSHFLGRGVASHVRRHGVTYPLSHVRDLLDEADLFIGNLESPLSASPGADSWRRVYRGAAASAATLRLGRRTFMSLANNHILEHGAAMLDETCELLSTAGIDHAGLAGDGGLGRAEIRFAIDSQTVQVLAVSLVRDITRRSVDADAVTSWLLERLRAEPADLRIVSLHWGDEYVHTPSPGQRQLARRLAEAGVHLIIGHHPHVLQPVERIGDTLVAYSLGNFLFDQDWTTGTRTGGILDLSFGEGRVLSWEFTATTCDRTCRPRIAEPIVARMARAILDGSCDVEERRYAECLASARRQMRLRMKAELIRNLPRVGLDTWHFLLTKRRRPRPIMAERPTSSD